jgi:RNA polymerase sigma-70 factor (ECF subfamily)
LHAQNGVDNLVSDAAAGNRAALESLLLHFHDPLFLFIKNSLCRSPAAGITSEDVLQETLIQAFRQATHIEARGSTAFFAWLKTIARTRYLNLIKVRNALKRGGGRTGVKAIASNDPNATASSILNLLAADQSTPSRIVRRKEAFVAINTALAGLEPARRQAIELRYGHGLSIQEVAERTGKNLGAVKMLIHRAVRELRAAVGNEFSAGA